MKKILGLVVVGLMALFCITGVVFLGWRKYTMPVYTLTQRTLTFGTLTYVTDVAELPLEPTNQKGWFTQIGKTPDGMTVHAIPQQPDRDYIVMSGEMFPDLVYRREEIAPIALQDLHVTAIELSENMGWVPVLKTTQDAAIIENVYDSLVHPNPAGNVAGIIYPYHLHLLSEQLPGLAYIVDVAVDNKQTVYVAQRMTPDRWLKVEGAFAEWVTKK